MSAQRIPRHLNRVLIVSSDDDLSLLLQFLLETDGVHVILSRTPDIAIQTVLRHPPEAIFFDLSFQERNSLGFLEFIQQTYPDISIFTVVRPECRTLAEKSLHTAAQGCLLTPVDYRGVKELLGDSNRKRRKDDPAALAAS